MTGFSIVLLYSLITIDTATKFLALAANIAEEPGIIAIIRAIPAAHRARIIDSGALKRGFSSKIITYMILFLSGTILDYILESTGNPSFFLHIVIPFLAFTEFLSILENLDQAGISVCSGLVEFIKRRLGRR